MTFIKNSKASSVMYRNYFSLLPEEFLKTINEDMFFQAMAKINGKSSMITDAGYIVFNSDASNLWNSNNLFDKKPYKINNAKQMYLALGKIDKEYTRKFAKEIINNDASNRTGMSLLNILKFKDINLVYSILRIFLSQTIKRMLRPSIVVKS